MVVATVYPLMYSIPARFTMTYKIIPFRTGCWSRCLPFAGNYGVMSAKPWRSAAGAAVTGFGRWGIDNRVIFQQNIILQFSVKLVCQSVIACVCYRKRIFMETM